MVRYKYIALIGNLLTMAFLLMDEIESFEIHVFYMKNMKMRTRSPRGYGATRTSNHDPMETSYPQSLRSSSDGKKLQLVHEKYSYTRLNLLPKEDIQQEDKEVDEDLNTFRSLMGTLYGIAGLAHAVDCFLGPSQLLVAAGTLPFFELPLIGQAIVTLWCLAGGLAFVLSHQGGIVADLGLIAYGVVEMLTASLSPIQSTFLNAAFVQTIVLVSWIYSRQKGKSGTSPI